ncbi:hypothetical protein I3760_01G183900 [Carya illinoinensis]|nr:hypothetical protein I3760_01G183900 [Carya illinoinensis]KAG2727973.1 hypothetical protein I3760_01G183900 [Carya illinoinensis]KAG2727974.1 hypothetical protein I3760_01G183900 [Carya illinoinensis]
MKNFPGTPGTLTGLVLRISQCVFAVGSIASVATTHTFFNFTAFCYLIASMGLQVIWSFVLAVLDAYSLVSKKVLHNPVLVSLFVVGDWVSLYETLTMLDCFTCSRRVLCFWCLSLINLNITGDGNTVSCSGFCLSWHYGLVLQ